MVPSFLKLTIVCGRWALNEGLPNDSVSSSLRLNSEGFNLYSSIVSASLSHSRFSRLPPRWGGSRDPRGSLVRLREDGVNHTA